MWKHAFTFPVFKVCVGRDIGLVFQFLEYVLKHGFSFQVFFQVMCGNMGLHFQFSGCGWVEHRFSFQVFKACVEGIGVVC